MKLHKVRWLTSQYWLLGVRNFLTDYVAGTVEYHLYNQQDPNGHLKLLYEDVVVKLQEELGRLGRMDLRPSTFPKGYGLDRVRKAAAGRVVLEYLTSQVNWDKLRDSMTYHLAVYGTVGVMVSSKTTSYPGLEPEVMPEDGEFQEGKAILQVVPPWEIFPIPSTAHSPEDVQGILRKRWVPLSWVKKQKRLRLTSDEQKLQVRCAPFGVKPKDSSAFGWAPLEDVPVIGKADNPNVLPAETEVKYVLLEEYFFYHEEKDRLSRWVVKIGDHIALNDEYTDQSVYCPIAVARYHPVGGFYGRSFVEILIPINAEAEQMAANLFQNIKDLDNYGILLMPQNFGINKNDLLRKDRTRRVVFYEVDPNSNIKDQATAINPVTSTDFPGKVLALANQMMDRLTRASDMMRGEAPGRVDSASGLSFLQEMTSIPLSVPASSIANAMAQVFKSLLSAAPEMVGDRAEFPLTGLDDSVIGLTIKPNQGTVALNATALPLPSELEVGIKDKLPSPPTVRMQKLIQALQLQLISPMEFKITVWKENLDFPVGSWAEQEAYRKSLLQTILLFNDGETPGQVIANAEADNPKIALLVLSQFMAKPEFTFASVEIRRAFEELKIAYQNMIGARYPEGMMNPEDEAQMQMQLDKAKMQMPGGPPQGLRPGM